MLICYVLYAMYYILHDFAYIRYAHGEKADEQEKQPNKNHRRSRISRKEWRK